MKHAKHAMATIHGIVFHATMDIISLTEEVEINTAENVVQLAHNVTWLKTLLSARNVMTVTTCHQQVNA